MSRLHRRHHPRHQTGKKLPPWAILLICAGAAILVTVLIGNLLRLWLDDETYHSLTDQKPPATTEEPYVSNVPRLNAYPFSVGDDLTEAASKRQLSLSINNPAGEIYYRSPVADFQGRARQGTESLTEAMGALNAYGTYVSGVYYPQGFEHADPNLRYAAAVEDSAILREYLQMGGREILLIGLPFASEGLDSILSYLRTVRDAIGNSPLGVAVTPSVIEGAYGNLVLEELLGICDFCALDLTGAQLTDETVNEIGICIGVRDTVHALDFYTKQYDMRLIVTEEQTLFVDTFRILMVSNFQVLTAQKTEEPPAPEQ
ncbi:MAG: hypothetical protein IKB75_00870 [Clostridia bacterium]|nr:hypothetical protein [Clostridia bacterium]